MSSIESLKYKVLKDSNCIRETKQGLLIDLEISPGSSHTELRGYNRWRDRILLSIHSPARKGHANKDLLKTLSKYLGINLDQIRILSGLHSELKTVEITGLDKEYIINKLIEVSNE